MNEMLERVVQALEALIEECDTNMDFAHIYPSEKEALKNARAVGIEARNMLEHGQDEIDFQNGQ